LPPAGTAAQNLSVLTTSLTALASTLKDLRLVYMGMGAEHVPALQQLTALVHLDVSEHKLGVEVTQLSTLTALTHLNIISYSRPLQPASVSPFAALTDLRTLCLGITEPSEFFEATEPWRAWSDLSALTLCQHLQELTLRGSLAIADIGDISALTALRVLNVVRLDSWRGDFTALPQLTSLTQLSLSRSVHHRGLAAIGDQLPWLTLAQLTNLRALHVAGATSDSPESSAHLTALSSLTGLSLTDCCLQHVREHIQSIVRITTLKHLDLSGTWCGRRSIAELQALPVLRHLELTVRCQRTHGLEALIGTPLKHLVVRPDKQTGISDLLRPTAGPTLESTADRLRASGIDVTVLTLS
jgi:hypothetical protein